MSLQLSANSKPVICSAISIDQQGSGLDVFTLPSTYRFEAHNAEILTKVFPYLDGTMEIGSLAEMYDFDEDDVIATLEVLRQDQLLIDETLPLRAPTQEAFLEAVFEEARFWNANMYALPFFKTLSSGEAPRSLVFGWGLEYYHFVESANEHMAMGVGYCRNNHALREMMIEHYMEEWDHSHIFLEGLVNSGLDKDQILYALPLVTTRALIDYLNELAYEHPLAYSACYGIMQSGDEATTAKEVNHYYDLLDKHYPYAKGMLDGIRKHALIDVGLGHHKTPLESYAEIATISMDERKAIVEGLRGTSEHFIQYFEGILDHYTRLDSALLRPPVDIRLFV